VLSVIWLRFHSDYTLLAISITQPWTTAAD